LATGVFLPLIAAGAGCERPDLKSDLLTDGPPETVIVAIASDSAGEAATFCFDQYDDGSLLDPLWRNEAYCPSEGGVAGGVTDAPPLGFFARVVFSELLDPSFETVIRADTDGDGEPDADGAIIGFEFNQEPVTISCGGNAVTTTGFWDPSGSHLSFPAGPAVVVNATSTVASGSTCQVAINDGVLFDKEGIALPTTQMGPFEFTLSPLGSVGTVPSNEQVDVDPMALAEAGITVDFNNLIDPTTATATVLVDGVEVAATVGFAVDSGGNPIETTLAIVPDGDVVAGAEYSVTVDAGLEDQGGASLADAVAFSFQTAPAQ